MGDMGDMYRERREWMKDRKRELGVDCPQCPVVQPKRIPTILMPQQRCRVCGYKDPRPYVTR